MNHMSETLLVPFQAFFFPPKLSSKKMKHGLTFYELCESDISQLVPLQGEERLRKKCDTNFTCFWYSLLRMMPKGTRNEAFHLAADKEYSWGFRFIKGHAEVWCG